MAATLSGTQVNIGFQSPAGWDSAFVRERLPEAFMKGYVNSIEPFMEQVVNRKGERVPKPIRQHGGGAVADRQKHVMLENKPLMAIIAYLLLEHGQLNEERTAVEVKFTKDALESLRCDYTVQWLENPDTREMTFRMLLEPQGVK